MTPRIIAANLVVRLKSLSRERPAIFFTIVFPVILVLVFGAIFTTPEHRDFDLPVQDLDQSTSSEDLLNYLVAGGVFRTTSVPADAEVVQFARDHKLTLVLVIPRGFQAAHARRVLRGDSDASVILKYIYAPSSTSVETKVQFLNSIIATNNQRMSGTLVTSTARRAGSSSREVSTSMVSLATVPGAEPDEVARDSRDLPGPWACISVRSHAATFHASCGGPD